MLRPKIGLDWDDVTAPFNSIAIAMANEKYHYEEPLKLEDIDSWENTGRANVIKEFYQSEELYRRQQVPEATKAAVRRLMEVAEIYFITAAYPKFMGIRAQQILDAFPELTYDHIILGNAKNMVPFDIILDDAVHNILESPATYTVMMRKPWNWKMTGLLSVNSMDEFVTLVQQIIHASQTAPSLITEPSVLALVGPSGSGKKQVADRLCEDVHFQCPKTYCTKASSRHHYLSEEEFNRQDFFEKTRYAGVQYGTKKEEIQAVLDSGCHAVMPLDMCGAIAMKRHFPTAILFINQDKEVMIRSIIEEDLPVEEKTLRILSLDQEKKNRDICDYVINNRDGGAVTRIRKLIR